MKAIGIIAEYNPFHNGHLYHLKKIKEKYPDYAILLVMTGNFTERGDVAIIDKWKRTEIALQFGIDLIIELPYPFSTQSADYFSYGAVTILEYLQAEKVIFGSESNNLKDIESIAQIQMDNNEFEQLVKIYSKLGENYPTAISNAIYDLTGKKITTPNDLLGVSYLKTILKNHYKIKAETIKRTNNYHEKTSNNLVASSTSIREALKNNKPIKKQVPKEVLPYLKNLHFIKDYFPYLKYKILTEKDLSIYQTVEEGIENLLKKTITESYTYEELIEKIKSKRYTRNKIQRMLLHILCNFTKEDAKKMNQIKYIRILGMNTTGRKYLNSIKKDIKIPIISKITKEKDDMLFFEIETSKIYGLMENNFYKKEFNKIIYKGEEND